MEFFGKTRVFTFDNGVRLGVMARPGVSFQLLCGFSTGSIHEGEDLGRGLSHIMEHMLFQGCEGYPGHRVNEVAQEWSASLNAYTSFDRVVITLGGPAAVCSDALAMVLAMARTPEFDPAALRGELDVILRECAMYADKPASRLFELALATLFRRHPVRCPVIGRVCMDQIMADVTAVPEEKARLGAPCVLLGRQGTEEITAGELAAWAGTISYEMLLAATARVPVHYAQETEGSSC